MGACASVFSSLQKNSAEAPPPAPEEELVASREVKLAEGTPLAADDEAKHKSLGHLFKDVKSNEGEKGLAEDTNGKTSEEVKQQDESEKSVKSGEALPASENVEKEVKKIEEKPVESVNLETEGVEVVKTEKPEENKSVEVSGNDEKPETEKSSKSEETQPASENVEIDAKKIEEKPVESVKLEREGVEILKTETPENKTVEVSGDDEKSETTEVGKYEGQTPASDADNKKEEEKPIEITIEKKPETLETEEQKPASDAENKSVEVTPTDISTIETSAKVEDKNVLEPLKTEESLDKKPDEESVKKPETPEISSEEQKPASDAEVPIAGEEKTTK